MKSWYKKEKLDHFKYLVDNGYQKQKDCDELEKLFKTFTLDSEEIVDKTINYFLSIEPEIEVSFTQLLSECFKLNALVFFDSNELFPLYNSFMRECKKRKIKIIHHEYRGPVGLPFNLGFKRVERPLIKKIVYNRMYGCWGMRGELSRTYIVFEPSKITFCSEPLDRYSNKNNCLIKVSYDPFFRNDRDLFEEPSGQYDYNKICFLAENIVYSHTVDERICDAVAASIEIHFDNKKKAVVAHLTFEETNPLEKMLEAFEPDCFKKAIGDEEE